MPIFISQHRPSVYPTAGHKSRYTAYSSAVLKNNPIPVSFFRVNNTTLTYSSITIKIMFQNNLLLIRPCYLVCTITYFPAYPAGDTPIHGNHQQIILSVMFHNLASFQQALFISIPFKNLHTDSIGFHIRQVTLQLLQLTGSIEYIYSAVIIKKQRGIMKMLCS